MPSFSPCSSRQVNVGRGTPLKACNMRAPVGGSITGGWAMADMASRSASTTLRRPLAMRARPLDSSRGVAGGVAGCDGRATEEVHGIHTNGAFYY